MFCSYRQGYNLISAVIKTRLGFETARMTRFLNYSFGY